MLLKTINDNNYEPADYTDRKTVKAVILGEDGRVLMMPSTLIGGGVEEGESDEEALHREALEEAGAAIEIIKPIGEIIGYRDNTKQRYLFTGYLCNYLSTISAPTTTDAAEQSIIAVWRTFDEAIDLLTSQIAILETEDPEKYPGTYERKLHNRQMALAFLEAARSL